MNKYAIPILLFTVAALSFWQYHRTPSSDLLATWMAGKFYADGVLDQIYSSDTALFTMRPPSEWVIYLRANGYNEAIYPFVYPPIWAWFGAALHRITTFETVSTLASLINPLLMGGMIALAAKMVAAKWSQLQITLITIILFSTSMLAVVSLIENQPQILVAFLMVLGVERTRAGSPIAGGLAMAFAASLKLYPAIFAIVWLAQGERKATAAFAIAGGAIGITSIALTGWPLHVQFLEQIRLISGSVLLTPLNYAIDPTIAHQFFTDSMYQIKTLKVLEPGELDEGWRVMSKSTVWRIADALLLLVVVIGLIRIARGKHGDCPLIWPLAFTLIALVSPLTWSYHYLAGLAFAAALLEHFPLRRAVVALFLVFFPISTLFFTIGVSALPWADFIQPLGTLAMAFYALFLWLAMRTRI